MSFEHEYKPITISFQILIDDETIKDLEDPVRFLEQTVATQAVEQLHERLKNQNIKI
jgi:hypothetical protein